ADATGTEEARQDVVAPPSLVLWGEHLPDPIEVEERLEEAAVPHQRVHRRKEGDRGIRRGRCGEQVDLVAEDEPRPAQTLDRDADELAALDELVAQCGPSRIAWSLRVRFGGAKATEDVPGGADAEEAVRAGARKHLVPELPGVATPLGA